MRRAAAVLNRVAKLRILDPACGSGSFLMGAYQYLLDGTAILSGAQSGALAKRAPRSCKPPRLAAHHAERKRILLANLYGVDIDAQAVEVTKLSLLLKVLEGETDNPTNHFPPVRRARAAGPGQQHQVRQFANRPGFINKPNSELTDEERYRINVLIGTPSSPKSSVAADVVGSN